MLVADGEDYLGEESVDLEVDDLADELVAAADLAVAFAGACGGGLLLVFEEGLEVGGGDAVVAAGGRPGEELAGEYPLFDGGIADVEHASGLARSEERLGLGHEFHPGAASGSIFYILNDTRSSTIGDGRVVCVGPKNKNFAGAGKESVISRVVCGWNRILFMTQNKC